MSTGYTSAVKDGKTDAVASSDSPKVLTPRHLEALRRAVSEAEDWRPFMEDRHHLNPAAIEEFDVFVREAKEALTILGIKPAK